MYARDYEKVFFRLYRAKKSGKSEKLCMRPVGPADVQLQEIEQDQGALALLRG
jgi:hypothetical protein